jgi:predicted DNA-binding transcriptional regulator AlpA
MKTPTIPAPATVAALEKIPHAARRMGISTCQLYREAKAGRLCIVKVGSRASAVSSAEVTAWIQARIAESAKKGGAQ